jgi:hypothetical protein
MLLCSSAALCYSASVKPLLLFKYSSISMGATTATCSPEHDAKASSCHHQGLHAAAAAVAVAVAVVVVVAVAAVAAAQQHIAVCAHKVAAGAVPAAT